MSAPYPNTVLTDICEQLLEAGLTQGQIVNLAKDIPGECVWLRKKLNDSAALRAYREAHQ